VADEVTPLDPLVKVRLARVQAVRLVAIGELEDESDAWLEFRDAYRAAMLAPAFHGTRDVDALDDVAVELEELALHARSALVERHLRACSEAFAEYAAAWRLVERRERRA
jgi:hypothetical protein